MSELTIDLISDDPRDDGQMPDASFWSDDGMIQLSFGDLHIRMTYGQAERLFHGYQSWMNNLPAEDNFNLCEPRHEQE